MATTILVVRREFRVDDTPTDPDATPTFTNQAGTYGIRATGGANVLTVTTPMVKVSTGVYQYEFTTDDGAEYSTAYTSWVKATINGVDYYFDEDHAAVTDPSTAAYIVTQSDLMKIVAERLEYTRTSGNWSATEEARLNELVKAGATQFYWPPPIDKSGKSHRWSFLRPVTTLATVEDQADYDLPAGFGGLVDSKLYYAAADNKRVEVTIGPVGEVLRYRQTDPASGPPRIAAVAPKTSTGTAVQQWQLMIGPAADDAYTLYYRYQITPAALDASHAYHLGHQMHSETLVASCLAIAESRYGAREAGFGEYFLQRLAASISQDHLNDPGHYGYMGDGPASLGPRDRHNYATFDGTLYENS